MKPRLLLSTLVLGGAAFLASAAAPALKEISVGAYSISLEWDPAWQVGNPDPAVKQVMAQFQLADPHDMLVQISAQGRPSADADSEAFVRHVIDSAVNELGSSSVEKKLEPRPFKHGDMHGYMLCATDRAPKPDEYKYICEGAATNGDVAVIYTVLYNDGGKAQAEKATAALEALRISQKT
jgi:hypothetical protein